MDFSFVVQLGDWNSLSDPKKLQSVGRFVRALVEHDADWLAIGDRWKRIPSLYASGVRFQREADGAPNLWQSIPLVLASGFGHCIGLSAWRVAELRYRAHEHAHVIVQRFTEQRPIVGLLEEFHVTVERANGQIEDPSRRLGMP